MLKSLPSNGMWDENFFHFQGTSKSLLVSQLHVLNQDIASLATRAATAIMPARARVMIMLPASVTAVTASLRISVCLSLSALDGLAGFDSQETPVCM